jgi:hypothetical protein
MSVKAGGRGRGPGVQWTQREAPRLYLAHAYLAVLAAGTGSGGPARRETVCPCHALLGR